MRVGVLGDNDNSAWSKESTPDCATGSVRQKVGCNLRIYEAAITTAAAEGVQVLVFPEYGLGGTNGKSGFFEPVDAASVGTVPCETLSSDEASERPQQQAMSCAARDHGMLLAVNMHTEDTDGVHRITEVAFGPDGTVLAVYHKNQLFPNEGWPIASIRAGPFNPTSFDAFGMRWGLVICWEGMKPGVDGDWSQLEGLVAQGAQAILWSVGDTGGTLTTFAHKMSKRFGLPVLATENKELGFLVDGAYIKDGSGADTTYTDTPLGDSAPEGYTGNAYVRYTELSFGSSTAGGVVV